MLAVLESVAEQVRGGCQFPADDVAVMLTYFREYFERVHHARESEVLYPAMAMLGQDQVAEVVGLLIADHDDNKMLLYSLTLFWEPGDLLEDERSGFADLVSTYAKRMAASMDTEERELFPAADQLPDGERDQIAARFERIGVGRRPMQYWVTQAQRLEREHLA